MDISVYPRFSCVGYARQGEASHTYLQASSIQSEAMATSHPSRSSKSQASPFHLDSEELLQRPARRAVIRDRSRDRGLSSLSESDVVAVPLAACSGRDMDRRMSFTKLALRDLGVECLIGQGLVSGGVVCSSGPGSFWIAGAVAEDPSRDIGSSSGPHVASAGLAPELRPAS